MDFIVGALFLFAIWVFISSVFTVSQKTVEIVEIFGKFYAAKAPGLQLKWFWPIASRAGVVNMRIREFKDTVGVKTSDNAFLTFPVAVQFQVLDKKVKAAFYELDNAEGQISSFVLNVVRSKAAGMPMNDLFRNREDIASSVKSELSERMSQYGYEIITVLVDEPQPSAEVQAAFNRVISASREKEAAANEAEAARILMVGEAKAEAESLELKATAYVNQRKIMAEGIKDSMAELRSGLKDVSDREILNYFSGIDLRDTIRDASKNGSVIIIPAEMGSSHLSKTVGLIKALESKPQDKD